MTRTTMEDNKTISASQLKISEKAREGSKWVQVDDAPEVAYNYDLDLELAIGIPKPISLENKLLNNNHEIVTQNWSVTDFRAQAVKLRPTNISIFVIYKYKTYCHVN